MIIKKRKMKKCPECDSYKLVQREEYGCDNCKEPIDLDKDDEERDYLRVTVFYKHREETDTLEFCSWECVFRKLRELKTDSFISLPYLSFERTNPKTGVKAFWKAVKEST